MALTLAQGAQLLANTSFLSRVRGAMVRAAIAVANEEQGSLSTDNWGRRRNLATRILNSPDSSLGAFASAVAADAASALTYWQPQPIAASTNANPAAVGFGAAHGMTSGDVVEIVGHEDNTVINGTWTVTRVDDWSFTVPVPGIALGGATGPAQQQLADDYIAYTVNSVFGPIAGQIP